MKKFSEIIGEQKTSYITEANDKGASLADKLLAKPIPKQPDYMVEDNPKMAQLADTFIKLINKRCGWDAYTFPSIKKIGDVQTVVVVNKKTEGEAVAITPTQNGTSAVLRYFLNFSATATNQEAEYTVSSKNMGTVKMFEFLFSVINNPSAYATGMYESKKNGMSNALNEAAIGEEDSFFKLYNAAIDTPVYAAYRRWTNPNMKKPGQVPPSLTWEGFQNAVEFAKAHKNELPSEGCVLAEELFRKTGMGEKIRQLLVDDKGNSIDLRTKGAAAFARYLYEIAGIRRENDIKLDTGENVELTSELQEQYNDTYRGLDISFARYLFGRNIDEFKRLVDEYFNDIEELSFRIERLSEYCHLPRLEKLKQLHVGKTGVIISGIAGIGKSDAWEQVKKKLNLKEGKDFALRDNGSCNASELYNFIYSNNGKLLVLDDTPNLFDSEFQVSLWKKVFEPKETFPRIESPKGQAFGEGTKGIFYSLDSCKEGGVMNSRKRYFKECPNIDKMKRKNISQANDDDESNIKTSITMVPDKMDITSRFLIITNAKEEVLQRALGDSWEAIRSRSFFKRLAPPVEVVWAKIKQKLLEVKENNDTGWFIPPQYVDEVIEVVENEFKEFGCDKLTWRAFTGGDLTEDFLYGRDWKKTLQSQITTRIESNDTLNNLRKQRRKEIKNY